MCGALNPCAWRQGDRLCEVVPELPMPVVLRHAQDCSRLAIGEHHAVLEIFTSCVHVRMNRRQSYGFADLKGSIDTIVGIAWRDLERAIARRQCLHSFFRWLFGENQA